GTYQKGIYHSSYLAGGTAMCAGSMLIEGGVIRKVKSDSGHYQPTDSDMLALLQCLRMLNVPIQNVVVVDFEGRSEVSAPSFFQANATGTSWLTSETPCCRTIKYHSRSSRMLI